MRFTSEKEMDWIARGAMLDARSAMHARAEAEAVESIGDPDGDGPAWRMQAAEAEVRIIAAAVELEAAGYRWGVIL